LDRTWHQVTATGDPVLNSLLQELSSYPTDSGLRAPSDPSRTSHAGVFVPLQLITDIGLLSFFSTTTLFGTPLDITLSELAIEASFPADESTRTKLQRAFDSQMHRDDSPADRLGQCKVRLPRGPARSAIMAVGILLPCFAMRGGGC